MSNEPAAHQRKEDHIRLAAEQQDELARGTTHSAFDDVDFLFHALDAISVEQISTETTLGPWILPAPLYINGMTGGTESALVINRHLAKAAAATGIPMASGSVGIALDEPETRDSFTIIRRENPNGIVWANIGAGRDLDNARRAVDLLEADGLQIHVNAIQETVMPEGSREFSTWLGLIEDIASALDDDGVPVIVKEVGFGLSAATMQRLADIGVRMVDIAGSGGTNFARIENDRIPGSHWTDTPMITQHRNFSWITALGASTPQCLIDAHAANLPQDLHMLASGGVRNPLDVVRSLALGARAVGVAGVFLRVAMQEGPEALTQVINIWIERIGQLQALFGASTTAELQNTDVLLQGRLADFARVRGVDTSALASRSR